MARGDGIQIRPAIRGSAIPRRLGGPTLPDRVHRPGQARSSSVGRPIATVGSRHRGRGPSAEEPPQRELAVRRRPLEKIHAPSDLGSGPETPRGGVQPPPPSATRTPPDLTTPY